MYSSHKLKEIVYPFSLSSSLFSLTSPPPYLPSSLFLLDLPLPSLLLDSSLFLLDLLPLPLFLPLLSLY